MYRVGWYVVPRPGFASITVRARVKERLEEYAGREGYATLSDAINSLLDKAEHCRRLEQRLEELEPRLRKIELLLMKILEELATKTPEKPETTPRKEVNMQ